MGRIFPPTGYTSMIGAVGIAGLILAVKRDVVLGSLSCLSWFSEKKSCLKDSYSLPGLQNLGNNCFLNVILQSLASCSYFQTFLQRTLEEFEAGATGETSEDLPLTDVLDALLEELCVAGEGKIILSPRRVMQEMAHYVPNFSLTSQQDATEALLHLLSSLREESLSCYIPNRSTLAVASASSGRIVLPRKNCQTEQERWQRHFLGPFDGISGSILTCQSCSSQISLVFEFFHTLALSPVLNYGSTTMADCTLVDCLKQFTVAEQVSNYCCSHCWHSAAMKYLSLTEESEMELNKVKMCMRDDSCECRWLFGLKTLPWSNDFSRTVRQTIIARSPEILCIQLQRVSADRNGDLIKLQGHISFPLVLDLSPFITTEFGMKNVKNMVRGHGNWQRQQVDLYLTQSRMQIDVGALDRIPGSVQHNINMKAFVEELGSVGENQAVPGQACSNELRVDTCIGSSDEMKVSHPERSHIYRLVSVVEHFGRAGSGHYTVFRSHRLESLKDGDSKTSEPPVQWFCISDSTVSRVSETDVLAAEASLLFYERIVDVKNNEAPPA